MRDSTVAIHRTVKKQGCPTRRVYAWGFVSYRHNRSSQRIKTATNQIKSPTRKPDVWATQFVPRLTSGASAHRREDQDHSKHGSPAYFASSIFTPVGFANRSSLNGT